MRPFLPVLPVIVLIALASPSLAQSPDITVDFNDTTKITKPRYVSAGKTVLFRLKNINRILYDVEVKGKTLSYNTTAPQGLAALLGIQGANIANFAPDRAKLEKIKTAVTTIRYAAQYEQSLKNILSQQPKIDDDTTTIIKTQAKDALTVKKSPIPPALVGETIVALGDADGLYDKAVGAFTEIEMDLDDLSRAAAGNPAEPDTIQAKVLLDPVNKLLGAKQDILALVLAGQRLYKAVDTGTIFYAETSVVANNDAVQFTYSVKPAKGFETAPDLKTVSKNVTVGVRGIWRVNFSGGLFLAQLADDSVTIGERTTTTTTTAPAGAGESTKTTVGGGLSITDVVDKAGNLTHTEKGRYVIGQVKDKQTPFAGALAHIYPAFGGTVQPAFSIGGGVTSNNPLYAVGGSLIIGGAERRVILTYGVAYGKVKRLSSDLGIGQLIPDSRTEITSSVYKKGSFVALTFNF